MRRISADLIAPAVGQTPLGHYKIQHRFKLRRQFRHVLLPDGQPQPMRDFGQGSHIGDSVGGADLEAGGVDVNVHIVRFDRVIAFGGAIGKAGLHQRQQAVGLPDVQKAFARPAVIGRANHLLRKGGKVAAPVLNRANADIADRQYAPCRKFGNIPATKRNRIKIKHLHRKGQVERFG